MTPGPRFSVITVCFNDLKGLKATRSSIEAQTFRDYEWIVIDGASTDGASEYLQSLPPESLTWVSEPDAGIYDGMNKGIALAGGDHIIFMNSGDLFAAPDTLQRVAAMTAADDEIVYGDSLEAAEGGLMAKAARPPGLIWYSMVTHHQAIFYARPLIAQGYDLSYRFSADWALTTRILARPGLRVRRLPIPICIFERGGVSQRDDQRRVIDREHWRILTQEARIPPPVAAPIWFLKTRVNLVRKHLPSLYDRLRFRRAS